jgi:hypothetical protein
MDAKLDELLATGAPRLARRGPEIERALEGMVADSERLTAKSRRRWRPRWVGAGVAGVLLIGGGVAGASQLIPTPTYGHTWGDGPATLRETRTLPSGAICDIEYAAEPAEATLGVNGSEWQATIDASHDFLRHFDLSSISVTAAVAREKAALRRQPPVDADERPPRPTPDDIVLNAITSEIYRQLSIHLRAMGLPARAVSIGQGSVCDRSIE